MQIEEYPPQQVADILDKEHPQIIAAALSLFSPEYSAQILEQLNERTRESVALRMITIESIQTRWVNKLKNNILKDLRRSPSKTDIRNYSALGLISEDKKRSLMNSISGYDPELAARVQQDLNS